MASRWTSWLSGKAAQSSSPLPLFDRVGCALQEPLGFETQQPPTLVAPPLIAGRDNTWITVSHGNATLPFVVSRPNDDSGEANAVVLLLPGCGHFYVENPSNTCGVTWPSRGPSSPVLGLWQGRQALRPPGCYLTAPPGRKLCIPQAAKSDVSPHISLPTYLIGLGSGGTIAYQIAVSETPASFRACVCMG